MRSAQPSSWTVWRYSHANFTLAEQLICVTDWDDLIDDDINTSWDNWQSKFLDIMDRCIPKKVLPPKRRNLPWLSKGIVQAMRRRNAMFKRAKRSGNEQDYAKYCRVRNQIVKDLRCSRHAYFQGLKPSNHKKFWKAVKCLDRNPLQSQFWHTTTPPMTQIVTKLMPSTHFLTAASTILSHLCKRHWEMLPCQMTYLISYALKRRLQVFSDHSIPLRLMATMVYLLVCSSQLPLPLLSQ